ncbi:MAG: OmpH family outer membrane protein [Parvularculaceae bacterium]
MKSRFLTLAGALALLAGGLTGGAALSSRAEAQQAGKAPVILIVDRNALVAQSDAGKSIPGQADSIKAAIQKELDAEGQQLQKDIEKYQKGASLMSEEVRKKTEQDLGYRQQVELPQQAKIMENVFGTAVGNAEAEILNASAPILKSIVDKRGATVLLDRAAVMYAAPETDVTQEVLAELNKKMKSVTVQKVTLSDVKKKIAEIQAKQAEQAQKAQKKKK